MKLRMSVLYGRVLLILTTLCFTRASKSKGISFSAKSYTFFLNDDINQGSEIASIRAEVTGGLLPPYYIIARKPRRGKGTAPKMVTIDPVSGKILLLRSLGNIRLRRDGTRRFYVNVRACSLTSKKFCTKTNIFIIALRKNFGDSLVPEAIASIKVNKLINHILPKKKGKKTKVTSDDLLRFLRKIPEEGKEISLAEAKQEIAIDYIRKRIVKRLAKGGRGNLNFDYLHLEKLFSLYGIKKLLNSESCISASKKPTHCSRYQKYRSFDGTCNNLEQSFWGAAGIKLERMLEPDYVDPDRLFLPKGSPDQFFNYNLPSPSHVSRDFIRAQTTPRNSDNHFSHALMQWGQFLDHDMDLTPEMEGADKCVNLPCNGLLTRSIPPCFPIVPIDNSTRCIRFTRSAAVCQADPSDIQPREQINVLTGFIDASQIYGSSERQANLVRSDKDGLVKITRNQLLVQHPGGLNNPNDLCEDMGGCFLSGDDRVNEQIALASMHTLFNREHNRIARELKKINYHWNNEKLFQETRKIVGAIMQKITYEDFLPKIIGKESILPFQNYQDDVNPGILNEFSAAAFRFGHSMIRPAFDLLDSGFNAVAPPVPLIKMFFNNTHIQIYGIESILLGLLANVSQNVDAAIAEGLTKHLFERQPSHGLNLAALNIQRGRDHGLTGYNKYRELCGMKVAETFDDTSNEIKNAGTRAVLEKLYKTPQNVDLWIAGLAEDPLPDIAVGPTFQCILKQQFKNLRDGDRFYYEAKDVFTREQLREVKKVTLSHIMCDNLLEIVSIQKDAFIAPTCQESRISCSRIREHSMDLNAWKDHAPCYSDPCLHGGHCLPINRGRNYQCICPPYWTGNNCQYRRHPCNPSPCVNAHDMLCRSEMKGSLFFCTCLPGMYHCNDKDFCKLSPCPFGYKCQNDEDDGYECVRTVV